MRLSWIGMGPDPTTRALTRDQVARATETQRETGDHRGTGWGILEATSQETRGPPDWKGKGSLLEPLEGVRPSPHHGFGLLVSKTTTASTSLVLSPPPPPLCGSSSPRPQETTTGTIQREVTTCTQGQPFRARLSVPTSQVRRF